MGSDVTAVLTVMTDAERPWVQSALASIFAQSVLPDAVIVLAEQRNSWLESDIAAQGYAADLLARTRIHRIPLALLGAVRNTGAELADSRWVGFLDGDDVWHPMRLELQMRAAAANPEARFIAGDLEFIDSRGRAFAFSNGSNPAPSSWLVDRQMLLEHPFDPSLPVGEDYFWLRDTRSDCVRVRVPRVLVGYRIRSHSVSAVQHGDTPLRKRREGMARAASNPLLRYPMLAGTYLRYLAYRGRPYEV